MEWASVQQAHTNAVFLIRTESAVYNQKRPYNNPTDSQSSGSGFCVDRSQGLVLTNSHVVTSAATVNARTTRTGNQDLPMTVLSICPNRDIALLRFEESAMRELEGHLEDVRFGDSDALDLTQQVLAAGYPLGQEEVKFTTGVVSGFHTDADRLYVNTFVQITAAINPGNSGGPLFNSSGEVVGVNAAGHMFAQSIGYAVPSRVVISIAKQMMASGCPRILHAAQLGLVWTPINGQTQEAFGMPEGPHRGGVLVTRVAPSGAPLGALAPGDLLLDVEVADPFGGGASDWDVRSPTEWSESRPVHRHALDTFGKCDGTPSSDLPRARQKRPLVEVMSTLPEGWPVACTVWRRGEAETVRWRWLRRPPMLVRELHSCFERPAYMIFGGMCVSPLSDSLLTSYKSAVPQLCAYDDPHMRHKAVLVVTRVFPATTTYALHALREGAVLQSVNGTKVRTLRQLADAVEEAQGSRYAVLSFSGGDLIVIDLNSERAETRRVCEANGIQHVSRFR